MPLGLMGQLAMSSKASSSCPTPDPQLEDALVMELAQYPVVNKPVVVHHFVWRGQFLKVPLLASGKVCFFNFSAASVAFTNFTVVGPCLVCEVALPSFGLALWLERINKKPGDGKAIFIWSLYRAQGKLRRRLIIMITADVGHEARRKVISSWQEARSLQRVLVCVSQNKTQPGGLLAKLPTVGDAQGTKPLQIPSIISPHRTVDNKKLKSSGLERSNRCLV